MTRRPSMGRPRLRVYQDAAPDAGAAPDPQDEVLAQIDDEIEAEEALEAVLAASERDYTTPDSPASPDSPPDSFEPEPFDQLVERRLDELESKLDRLLLAVEAIGKVSDVIAALEAVKAAAQARRGGGGGGAVAAQAQEPPERGSIVSYKGRSYRFLAVEGDRWRLEFMDGSKDFPAVVSLVKL